MTEKQFTTHIDECGMYYYIFDGKKILAEAFYKDDAKEIVDKLNTLYEENQKLQKENVENKKLIQLGYNENTRLRNKNKRLHKDWDKLWELCKEHFTDEEIIKELDR